MNDVSAVVLTLGERTTARALASLRRQTLPPAAVIMVTGEVRPFHRALNTAAQRVRTPFFVQVDVDMILDPFCFEALRAAVRDDAGMVIGQLLDPMLGAILGVRLFRRRCVRELSVPDSLSPVADFEVALQRSGWSLLCALRYRDNGSGEGQANLFGEHRPDYHPLYVFRKYSLSGARNRYRGTSARLRAVFERLQSSGHPAALLARIAAAHGIFDRASRDRLGREVGSGEFDRLSRFMRTSGLEEAATSVVEEAAGSNLRTAFHASVALGVELHRRRAFPTVAASLADLGRRADEGAWTAAIGICHGLFFDRYDAERVEDDFEWLLPLLCSPESGEDRSAAEEGASATEMLAAG